MIESRQPRKSQKPCTRIFKSSFGVPQKIDTISEIQMFICISRSILEKLDKASSRLRVCCRHISYQMLQLFLSCFGPHESSFKVRPLIQSQSQSLLSTKNTEGKKRRNPCCFLITFLDCHAPSETRVETLAVALVTVSSNVSCFVLF
jgi:hypothetical protein